jgi:hypothetical protein
MFRDLCNRHASSSRAGSKAVWSGPAACSPLAQGKSAQPRRRLLGAFLAALALAGCASAPGAGSASSAVPRSDVDAVLPSREEAGEARAHSWRLFRLGAQRFARVPAESAAWAGEAWTRAEWKTLPSPGGAFRPVQAVQAARGYFLLVDAASSRLCLYDTSAGLISTFPLPERFTPFPAGRAAVFRGADGTFIFADYASGEAWQYADREAAQGAASWVLRARVKMPMGWRDCYQQPGSQGLACRIANGASRFDGTLNRTTGTGASPGDSRLDWDAEKREWVLTGVSSEGGPPLFRFRPATRTLVSP